MPMPRYIIAPSYAEASDAAHRRQWSWPREWQYVGHVDRVRELRQGSTVYVTGDDQLTTVRARLLGVPTPSLGALLAPLLAECQNRHIRIEILT